MTRVTTANVLSSLDARAAARCLDAVLAEQPDVVGLQEWRIGRAALLDGVGAVRFAGFGTKEFAEGPITWVMSVPGDCVVGLRSARFSVRRTHLWRLGGLERADAGARFPPVLPPRWATIVEAHDRHTGGTVGLICYHLVPGAQSRGGYRVDRPRVSARHRVEVARLQTAVDVVRSRCDVVWAMGDSNFHGLALDGLVSAWSARPGAEGTLGSYRRIDDVFSTSAPTEVSLLAAGSDHRFVQVDYL